jgi:very-short-patch-repair endonuclease
MNMSLRAERCGRRDEIKMPKGIYKRTAEHKAIAQRNMLHARQFCHTEEQLAAFQKNAAKGRAIAQSRPKTEKFMLSFATKVQVNAWSAPRSEAQLATARKGIIAALAVANGPDLPRGMYERTEEHRAICRENMLKAQAAFRTGPSNIQIQFFNVLKQSIPSLRCDDLTIRVGRYWFYPDIVNTETRKIVEVDGWYWHDKDKDKIRDACLRGAGWDTLRFPAERQHLFKSNSIQKAVSFLLGESYSTC